MQPRRAARSVREAPTAKELSSGVNLNALLEQVNTERIVRQPLGPEDTLHERITTQIATTGAFGYVYRDAVNYARLESFQAATLLILDPPLETSWARL